MAERNRIDIRLAGDMRSRIDDFGKAIGEANLSAVIRVLLSTGLERLEEADRAYRAQAYREGVLLGVSKMRVKLTTMLSELEVELAEEEKRAASR